MHDHCVLSGLLGPLKALLDTDVLFVDHEIHSSNVFYEIRRITSNSNTEHNSYYINTLIAHRYIEDVH